MKLKSPLVVLTLAASIFANSIPVKRQEYLSPSCQRELENLDECDFEYYKDIDIICDYFNTKKCQQFYKNGIKSLKGCKNDKPEYIDIAQGVIDAAIPTFGALCARDENGEACPVSALKINLMHERISLENYFRNLEGAIRETCKSQLCTDAYLEYEISKEAKIQIQQIRNSTNNNDTQLPLQNPTPLKRQIQQIELTQHTQQAQQVQQVQQTQQAQQTQQTQQIQQAQQTQQTQQTQHTHQTQQTQQTEHTQKTEHIQHTHQTPETQQTQEPKNKQETQQKQESQEIQKAQPQVQQTQGQIQQNQLIQQNQQIQPTQPQPSPTEQAEPTHSRYYEYQRAFEFVYSSAEFMISEECQSQIQTQPRSQPNSSDRTFKTTTATILGTCCSKVF